MEFPTSWAILAFVWLAALPLVSKMFSFLHKQQKLPPGPKPWPIIGNLNLMGPLLHRSLHKLSQKYGPIMQLKFGSFPVVVASSPQMAKQFLKTHDHIFASRPKTAAGRYTNYNYSDILCAPYGPYVHQGRKIFLTQLFTTKRLDSYEYIRVEEMRAFLSRLYALSGKPIVLRDHLSRLNLSVISRIVLGKNYFSESKSESEIATLTEFQGMLDEWVLLNGRLNIGDWIPWLGFLDLQGYVKRMKALRKRFDRFHDYVIDEHQAMREAAGTDFVAKDMVDVLLQLADDPNLEVKLTRDCLKGLTQELLAGGTESAAITVEWAMSELLKHPHILERATEELDRVVGRERWVEEKDIPQLPYIDTIMKETMRMHPVSAMLAPHLALENCNVAGYDIRKGTRIFINIWSIGRDPTVWDATEEFRPERFLGKAIDVKGQSFELLPFGSGRRMCPGYSLGLRMIRTSLANIIHGFNWRILDNMKIEELSMEEVFGLSTLRKIPLEAVMEPRLSLHLY